MTDPVAYSADPGLQPQRTGMAWTRSLLLTVVSSVLCFRVGFTHHSLTMFVCCVVLLMLAALMAMMSWRRYRVGADPHSLSLTRYPIACTAAMVVLTALVLASHFLLGILG